MKLQRLVRVYTCQNVKLLEISCRRSYTSQYFLVIFFQVFLLTDGEVMNTQEVIGLVKANAEKAR